MTKTLTVSIEDVDKQGQVSISGSLDELNFNTMVILNVAGNKVALNSQELAKALAEVVDFQSQKLPKVSLPSQWNPTDLPSTGSGIVTLTNVSSDYKPTIYDLGLADQG